MKTRILISSLGAALSLVMANAIHAAPITLVNAVGVNKEVANKGSITDTRTATGASNKVIKDGLVISIAAGTEYVGDYTFTLSHGGKTVNLFNPNRDSSNLWVGNMLKFSDSHNAPASALGTASNCGTIAVIGVNANCGSMGLIPVESLSAFNGLSANGDWILGITDAGYDNTSGRDGRNGTRDLTLATWTLTANLIDAPLKPASVPEPASLALVGLALGGAMLARRRNKKA